MIGLKRASLRTAALSLLCLALVLPAAAASAAEATVHYTKESLQAYEQQLASGQVKAATFNKKIRALHLELKNGEHIKVTYAAKTEPALSAALTAKHVPVTILKPAAAEAESKKAPVKHKLRYIAGGILIAVVLIVGAVLLIDRRRKRMAE
jgi:hypothetical protein